MVLILTGKETKCDESTPTNGEEHHLCNAVVVESIVSVEQGQLTPHQAIWGINEALVKLLIIFAESESQGMANAEKATEAIVEAVRLHYPLRDQLRGAFGVHTVKGSA